MTERDPIAADSRTLVFGRRHARRSERFCDGRLEISSPRGTSAVDSLLLSALSQRIEGRVLSIRSREGVVALGAASLFPEADVVHFDLDAFERHRAIAAAVRNGVERVSWYIGADLPPGPFDWVLLAAPGSGDAALAGDLVRQSFVRLTDRGKIVVATDARRDRWVHARIRDVFGDVTIHVKSRAGIVYVARKPPGRSTRTRNTARECTGRLFDRVISLVSRPGVFGHGKVDDGALSLADVAGVKDDARSVDLGCGSGAIGVAAALAAPNGTALLVDSNARAVACARENLARNGAANGAATLAYDLSAVRGGSVDLVFANPPYFGDFRIAERFTRDAARVLAPGGEYYLVTKSVERPEAICRESFAELERFSRRGYTVFRCTAPRSSG